MKSHRRLFIVAAGCSFALAALHVACVFTGEATARFFGAPRYVVRLIQEQSPLIIPVVLAIVAILGTFGLYAWSAGGLMRRLPRLRAGLVVISGIYLLRGLVIVPLVLFAWRHPGAVPWQFFAFSLIALALGSVYLLGTVRNWQTLASPLSRPPAENGST